MSMVNANRPNSAQAQMAEYNAAGAPGATPTGPNMNGSGETFTPPAIPSGESAKTLW